jgi:CRISPR-associated protein Csd2
VAHTTAKDAEKPGGTMGNKWTIPYGLYEATLSYSATRGAQTGVTERDLELLYLCLVNMFDHTASAARASMAARSLVVFTHSDAFGRAPMHALVERVSVTRADGIDVPRSFADYLLALDFEALPEGVTVDKLL